MRNGCDARAGEPGILGCFAAGHKCAARRRRALAMTDTELRDIANAATTGLSRMPKAGYRTPAATGMPIAL
jgi:hypothetical protein